MSYDPDDFDNNPFAEPQRHDVLNSDEFKPDQTLTASLIAGVASHYADNPYNNVYDNGDGALAGTGGAAAGPLSGFADDGNSDDHNDNNNTAAALLNKQKQDLPSLPPGHEEVSINDDHSYQQQQQHKQEENQQGQDGEQQQGEEQPKEFKPDLTLLPERRSKKNYKISIKVAGIERVAKKDPIVKFDAYTNLPNFRGTVFKDIRRSYNELEKFFSYLNGANPECFIPGLPAPLTSFGAGSEEDEATVTRQLQEWFDKITSNPILIRNEEFVFFVENDFGYSPINKGKVPATGLKRKTLKQFQPPYDEVVELVEFRPYIKLVYLNTQNIIKIFDKLTKLRKTFGLHVAELGNKITDLAVLESMHPGMVNLWQKFGKSMVIYGDIEAIKAVYEQGLLGDEVKMISNDAYIIKEQLTNRHLLMRELLNAEQLTRSRHAQALKIKTKKYEDPIKIDQIISELEDSKKVEDNLRLKVKRISSNMLIEKNQVLNHQEKKLKRVVRDYTKKIIENERKILSNFEKIRIDVRLVDENGGLSRLGRENYPKLTSNLRNSQRYDGDDWSGDRKHRRASSNVLVGSGAGSASPDKDQAISGAKNKLKGNNGGSTLALEDEEEEPSETVDARSAATLLGTLTF